MPTRKAQARWEGSLNKGKGAGLLPDLLEGSDVVVDCTPKKVGARYREVYGRHRIEVVLQGGEKHEAAGHSFVAQAL